MPLSRRFTRLAAVAASAALVPAAVAAASHHGTDLRVESTLAGSMPADPAFHGVRPGGVPWLIDDGSTVKAGDGKLDLRVRGLVIPDPPGDGTAGGVTSITASLFCGGDASPAPADTSESAPLSRSGNGRIQDGSFAVPATCLAPIVVVHPNGNKAAYIAVTGARP
jgi:hypothetical protein